MPPLPGWSAAQQKEARRAGLAPARPPESAAAAPLPRGAAIRQRPSGSGHQAAAVGRAALPLGSGRTELNSTD